MAEISGVQHVRRRSTIQQLLLFTGSTGEIAADMTNMRVSLQDGVTAGGWLSQKGNIRRLSFTIAGITRPFTAQDAFLYCLTSATFSVLVQLPLAAAALSGQVYHVIDAGNLAGTQPIGITTATSTEKIIGYSGVAGFQNSTGVNLGVNGFGVKLTPLPTAGVWAIWN